MLICFPRARSRFIVGFPPLALVQTHADIADMARLPRIFQIYWKVSAKMPDLSSRRAVLPFIVLARSSRYRIVGWAADRPQARIIFLAENSSWPARWWWLPSVREMTVRISSNFGTPRADERLNFRREHVSRFPRKFLRMCVLQIRYCMFRADSFYHTCLRYAIISYKGSLCESDTAHRADACSACVQRYFIYSRKAMRLASSW